MEKKSKITPEELLIELVGGPLTAENSAIPGQLVEIIAKRRTTKGVKKVKPVKATGKK